MPCREARCAVRTHRQNYLRPNYCLLSCMHLKFKGCFLAWLVLWLTCDVGQSTNWTLWTSSVWRRTSPAFLFSDPRGSHHTGVQKQLPSAVAQECVRWQSLFCILLDTASPSSFFMLHLYCSWPQLPESASSCCFVLKQIGNKPGNVFVYWNNKWILLRNITGFAFFRDWWKGDWQWDLHFVCSMYFDCYLKLLWERVTKMKLDPALAQSWDSCKVFKAIWDVQLSVHRSILNIKSLK